MTSERWGKGQEQWVSEVPARGLLLEEGGITQNEAVWTGLLEVRGLWVRKKLYQHFLGGGQNGARLVDCTSPLGCSSKDAGTQDQTVHRTRRNLEWGCRQIGEHEGGFLHWKVQLLQHWLLPDLFQQCCLGPSLNQEKKGYAFGPSTEQEVSFKMQLYRNQKED